MSDDLSIQIMLNIFLVNTRHSIYEFIKYLSDIREKLMKLIIVHQMTASGIL